MTALQMAVAGSRPPATPRPPRSAGRRPPRATPGTPAPPAPPGARGPGRPAAGPPPGARARAVGPARRPCRRRGWRPPRAHRGPGRGTSTRCPRSTPSSARPRSPGRPCPRPRTTRRSRRRRGARTPAWCHHRRPPRCSRRRPRRRGCRHRCRRSRRHPAAGLPGERGGRGRGAAGRSWSRLEEVGRARAATVVLMWPDPTGRFPCCGGMDRGRGTGAAEAHDRTLSNICSIFHREARRTHVSDVCKYHLGTGRRPGWQFPKWGTLPGPSPSYPVKNARTAALVRPSMRLKRLELLKDPRQD